MSIVCVTFYNSSITLQLLRPYVLGRHLDLLVMGAFFERYVLESSLYIKILRIHHTMGYYIVFIHSYIVFISSTPE